MAKSIRPYRNYIGINISSLNFYRPSIITILNRLNDNPDNPQRSSWLKSIGSYAWELINGYKFDHDFVKANNIWTTKASNALLEINSRTKPQGVNWVDVKLDSDYSMWINTESLRNPNALAEIYIGTHKNSKKNGLIRILKPLIASATNWKETYKAKTGYNSQAHISRNTDYPADNRHRTKHGLTQGVTQLIYSRDLSFNTDNDKIDIQKAENYDSFARTVKNSSAAIPIKNLSKTSLNTYLKSLGLRYVDQKKYKSASSIFLAKSSQDYKAAIDARILLAKEHIYSYNNMRQLSYYTKQKELSTIIEVEAYKILLNPTRRENYKVYIAEYKDYIPDSKNQNVPGTYYFLVDKDSLLPIKRVYLQDKFSDSRDDKNDPDKKDSSEGNNPKDEDDSKDKGKDSDNGSSSPGNNGSDEKLKEVKFEDKSTGELSVGAACRQISKAEYDRLKTSEFRQNWTYNAYPEGNSKPYIVYENERTGEILLFRNPVYAWYCPKENNIESFDPDEDEAYTYDELGPSYPNLQEKDCYTPASEQEYKNFIARYGKLGEPVGTKNNAYVYKTSKGYLVYDFGIEKPCFKVFGEKAQDDLPPCIKRINTYKYLFTYEGSEYEARLTDNGFIAKYQDKWLYVKDCKFIFPKEEPQDEKPCDTTELENEIKRLRNRNEELEDLAKKTDGDNSSNILNELEESNDKLDLLEKKLKNCESNSQVEEECCECNCGDDDCPDCCIDESYF